MARQERTLLGLKLHLPFMIHGRLPTGDASVSRDSLLPLPVVSPFSVLAFTVPRPSLSRKFSSHARRARQFTAWIGFPDVNRGLRRMAPEKVLSAALLGAAASKREDDVRLTISRASHLGDYWACSGTDLATRVCRL